MRISALKNNPKNPRKISAEALQKLCESIERDPQFMVLRPIVIDADGIVLGGNQRLKACKKLGMKELPENWVVQADDLSEEQKKRFILVDNAPDGMAGIWDFEALQVQWDLPELESLGFGVTDINCLGEERAGSSPWERVGEKNNNYVLFSFGEIVVNIHVEIYNNFRKKCPENDLSKFVEGILSGK